MEHITWPAPFNLEFDLETAAPEVTPRIVKLNPSDPAAVRKLFASLRGYTREALDQLKTYENAAGVKLSEAVYFSASGPSFSYVLVHSDPPVLIENAFGIAKDSIQLGGGSPKQEEISEDQARKIAENFVVSQEDGSSLPETVAVKFQDNVWYITATATSGKKLITAEVEIDASTGEILGCRYL